MSEENFYAVTYVAQINGDQWTLRARDADEFNDLVTGLAKNGDNTVEALSSLKQVVVAKGVFTGKPTTGRAASSGERAADAPPPKLTPDGIPLCDKHGEPMKDFGDRNYKYRWYCPKPKAQSTGCDPKGLKD